MAKSINVITQDFDTIRASIVDWLKADSRFNEYNFDYEGTSTSLLLDILAAFAYKNNIYTSAAFNEVFLSTAKTRNAIVRSAKELNYNIASPTAARARLNLKFYPTEYVNSISIPIYTKFTASQDSTTYEFVTTESYTVIPDINNVYEIDIDVVQGSAQTYTYNVTNNQKVFTLPNKNIDTSLLVVKVKENSSDNISYEYMRNTNITDANPNSLIYFIQEGIDEYFEIYFGDNVIGKSIVDGNVINIEYVLTDAEEANGINTFSLADNLTYTPTITTLSVAQGGKPIENIDSIKFYAPKNYEAQERAVTEMDYQTIIKQNFTEIDSLNAWGGEDNDPPYYGYVCLSALTKSNYELSENLKDNISESFEDNYIIGSKRLKWIDPEIVYLITDINAYFNRKATTKSPQELIDIIIDSMNNYEEDYISNYKKTFKYTPFVNFIKESDNSFTDINCNIKLQSKIEPLLNISTDYKISFLNELKSGTVATDAFYDENSRICYLDDDSLGNIRKYTLIDNVKTILDANAGTINYTKGLIRLNSLNIKNLVSSNGVFKLKATPSFFNITSSLNVILKFDTDNSSINVIKDINA